MVVLKKLIFAPFFLISFGLLLYQIHPLLSSYDFIFSLSVESFITLLVLSVFILLTSLIFVLFSTFSLDWKFIIPVIIIACVAPLLIFSPDLGLVFAVGTLVSLLFTFINLESSLRTYLNFQPATLFGPSIRHLCGLLILVLCVTYFLSINKIINETGFMIPDSIIDTSLIISSPEPQQPTIAPELLKTSQNLIKQVVKDQMESLIKPYLGFIPAILTVLLFFTLQAFTSMLTLLIYPLLWVIFYFLEKSGFISFTTEMRPVKKMVV